MAFFPFATTLVEVDCFIGEVESELDEELDSIGRLLVNMLLPDRRTFSF